MARKRSLEVIKEADTVTIGELSRLTNIRYSTLKHYTEEGLLDFIQEGENLTRRYPRKNSLDRLDEIMALREKSVAIKDIKNRLGLVEKDHLSSIFLSLLGNKEIKNKDQLEKISFILDYYDDKDHLPDKLEKTKLKEPSKDIEKNIYYLKASLDRLPLEPRAKLLLWALKKLDALDYSFSRYEIEKLNNLLVDLNFTDSFMKKLSTYKI